MKIIDGAYGEGGGQILRTALSLSMCTGVAVKIKNIRAGRSKPGLLRQHLTCVRASKAICNATVKGDELGSQIVEFIPGAVRGGKYDFAIGSAGSTVLVFQTVLPALLTADTESQLFFEGGTHNKGAPSFDFLHHCFLPVLAKMNIKVESALRKYGFYPNGGGAWQAKVFPMAGAEPLHLVSRGEILAKKAIATSSKIPTHVSERELLYVLKKCRWDSQHLEQNLVDSYGPGNIFSLRVETPELTEIFETVGEYGLSAERVAGRTVRDMNRYLASAASVGEHLCDQLLIPLVLANGGVFRSLKPSMHTQTNIDVIKAFCECDISVVEIDEDLYEISVLK